MPSEFVMAMAEATRQKYNTSRPRFEKWWAQLWNELDMIYITDSECTVSRFLDMSKRATKKFDIADPEFNPEELLDWIESRLKL